MTRPYADLHLHTHYSDGRAAPAEVVRAAAKAGLKAIAITDHDSTQGSREGEAVAQAVGLELIPALECTCSWQGYSGHGGGPDVDLLGYFVDFGSEALKRLEASLHGSLSARAEGCCERLSHAGYPLSLTDIAAQNPHFPGFGVVVQALTSTHALARKEATLLVEEAWRETRPSVSVAEAIEAIRAAHGVAVLAHPSVVRRAGGVLQQDDISALVDMGLEGIEVYHYRLNALAREHFARLAQSFDLITTGGSDEHGWPQGLPRLGSEAITLETVEALRIRSLGRAWEKLEW